MGRPRAETGRLGEQMAADLLEGSGIVIEARNWRGARGELDIVGLDGGVLVFYEVKTRSYESETYPTALAVNWAKLARIRSTASQYMMASRGRSVASRLELLTVHLTPQPRIERIPLG